MQKNTQDTIKKKLRTDQETKKRIWLNYEIYQKQTLYEKQRS
jgi:hypothetical protein